MRAALRLRSSHDRAIAALAWPAMGSLIADPLLSLVDTGFVGRVGLDALAGLGVSAAVFGVAFFLFNFLEYGTTTEVAGAVGRGDISAAGRATATAGVLAMAAGLGVTAILIILAGPIVSVMGASGDAREAAITYVMIRALAAPAVLVVRAGHGAYRGYQDTSTPFRVTLGMNGLNLMLDPLLIFGAGLGVAGAAWATVAAQWAGAAIFVLLFAKGKQEFGLAGARPVGEEVSSFLRVGRDLAIRTGSLLGAFTLATAVAARVSDTSVAAHQVLFQIFLFLALAVDALAIAAQALVGKHLGAGDRTIAAEISDRLLVMGIIIGLALAAALVAIAPFVAGWFTDDVAVVVQIESVYWLVVAIQPVAGAVFVWDGVFIGAGDFGFLAVATLGAAAAASALLMLVLPLGWGLAGVWWGIALLLAMRLITLVWRRSAASSRLRV